MRTTVTIPDDMLDDLMRFTDAQTRTEAVNHAVAEWVRRKKIERLRGLRGKLPLEGDLRRLRRLEVTKARVRGG